MNTDVVPVSFFRSADGDGRIGVFKPLFKEIEIFFFFHSTGDTSVCTFNLARIDKTDFGAFGFYGGDEFSVAEHSCGG